MQSLYFSLILKVTTSLVILNNYINLFMIRATIIRKVRQLKTRPHLDDLP